MCQLCNDFVISVFDRRNADPRRPVERYKPMYLSALRHREPPGLPVNLVIIDALLTALANAHSKGAWYGCQNALRDTRINAFRRMSNPDQMQLINNVWELITEERPPLRNAAEMIECAPGALPTSWRPRTKGNVSTCAAALDGNPWQTLGIGFRVEGNSDSSVQRIREQGMVAQNRDLAGLKVRTGSEYTGTVIADRANIRWWRENDDIVNETAVCVSRNLFGATAFPFRSSSSPNAYYLWSVNCLGLVGYDSEAAQKDRVWKPGEKAFVDIAASRILGWVPIHRRGCSVQGGWKFFINAEAFWNWIHPPQDDRVWEYLSDELDQWKGHEYNIPPSWDFA